MNSVEAGERFAELAALLEKGQMAQESLSFIAGPYLHYPKQDSVNLTWECNRPAQSRLQVVASVDESGQPVESVFDKRFPADGEIQVAEINGLEPDTRYFYRIEAIELSSRWRV